MLGVMVVIGACSLVSKVGLACLGGEVRGGDCGADF